MGSEMCIRDREEAGGTFTDWRGTPTIFGGEAVATNGALFEPVMELIQ